MTVDVAVLYPSTPHEVELHVLRVALGNRERKSINIEDLIKMAEFVLKKMFFEFNGKVKQQSYTRSYMALFLN